MSPTPRQGFRGPIPILLLPKKERPKRIIGEYGSDIYEHRGAACLTLLYREEMLAGDQGLRATATPNLDGELTTLGSYSAERVTYDLGLHSCWQRSPAFPLLLNLVLSVVEGSSAWELPMVK